MLRLVVARIIDDVESDGEGKIAKQFIDVYNKIMNPVTKDPGKEKFISLEFLLSKKRI